VFVRRQIRLATRLWPNFHKNVEQKARISLSSVDLKISCLTEGKPANSHQRQSYVGRPHDRQTDEELGQQSADMLLAHLDFDQALAALRL
jgi:hypothetical protein